MQISRKIIIILLPIFIILGIFSCKKEQNPSTYIINENDLYPPGAEKTKLKTSEQWVSILHTNLFQTALSGSEIFEISQVIQSTGDKQLTREVIISNFMNKQGVIMPSKEEMNNDLNTFITQTYQRFLVRNPTKAELAYFTAYITANPNVDPELIYFSFALSNEYLYY